MRVNSNEKNVHKGLTARLYILFVLAIPLMACYAFGLFDSKSAEHVENRNYATGDFSYSGDLKDDRFDGAGDISFGTGETYKGNFSEGRFDGSGVYDGIFIPADGNDSSFKWRLEGIFENAELISGNYYYPENVVASYKKGLTVSIFTTPDGTYEGEFDARGQTGVGRYDFADGSVYEGSFFRGSAQGEGTYTDPQGDVLYKGGFSDGKFDGYGVYTAPEGWSYEGGFKAGLFHGEGALTKNGETIRGVWEDGKQTTRYES